MKRAERAQETNRIRKELWSRKMIWLTKILRNSKKKGVAFTIIELLFVVIVIAILAAAGVALYIRSLDKARAAEGLAILSSVRTHYLVELVENEAVPLGDVALKDGWGIDTTKNKWWKEGEGFDTDWTWYTTTANHKVALIGKGATLGGKALSIECETGEIMQNYGYGGSGPP